MKPDGSLSFLKYPKLTVLWIWIFFQIPGPSGRFIPNFLKYLELAGTTKTSDTHPHTGGSMDTLSNPG
jgi:hypothetical protein